MPITVPIGPLRRDKYRIYWWGPNDIALDVNEILSVKKYNGFEKCIEGFVCIFLKYQVQKLNSNKIFPFFVIKIKFYPLCTKLYYRKCVFIFLLFHCNAFASLNCALTEIRLILQKQFFTKPNQTLIVTEVLSVFATFHKMN